MMMNLDLQRAEVALKAGRLEEVQRLLADPKLAGRRAGQDLITRVADALVQRAQSHLSNGHLSHANEDARSANQLAGGREDVVDLLKRIQSKVNDGKSTEAQGLLDDAAQAYYAGRLDRLRGLRNRLLSISPSTTEIEETLQQIRRCELVSDCLHSGQLDEARRELSVMANCFDDNGWSTQALELLEDVIPKWNQLRCGPLGLTTGPTAPYRPTDLTQPSVRFFSKGASRVQHEDVPAQHGSDLHGAKWLQIDGLGRLMLFTQPTVTIGSVRESNDSVLPPDIRLETDGIRSPLIVRRSEDDYLASSESDFVVGEKRVSRLLLQNDHRIQIGKRGRLRFRKPVAASATAVLQLTGAGMVRRDVRNVVLLADSILFGAQGCHFKVDGIAGVVMLSLDNGRFTLRRYGEKASVIEMRPSETVRMDGVGFRLMETI